MQAKVEKLANDLVNQVEAMKTLTVTQKDFEAMEREVALKTKELEHMGKTVATKDKASLDLEVCMYANTLFQGLLDFELSAMATCMPARNTRVTNLVIF